MILSCNTGRTIYDPHVFGNFVEKTGKGGSTYQAPGWTPADEKGCGVKVWATLKGEDEPRELELLLSQATVRNSTLWASDPKQQLAYLAVKRWSRLYTPDVIMGVYTPDELAEIPGEKNITPGASELNAVIGKSRTEAVKEKAKTQAGSMSTGKQIITLTNAIKATTTKADLKSVGEAINSEPEAVQEGVRAAYKTQLASFAPPAETEPEPSPESPAWNAITNAIDMAASDAMLAETDNMTEWAGLWDGEAVELRKRIDGLTGTFGEGA